jgi:hypothetical protein
MVVVRIIVVVVVMRMAVTMVVRIPQQGSTGQVDSEAERGHGYRLAIGNRNRME